MSWLKNTRTGRPDASLTLLAVVALVVVAKVLGSGISITIGHVVIAFAPFDAGLAAAVLAPFAALYGGRKYTDRHEPPKPLPAPPVAAKADLKEPS